MTDDDKPITAEWWKAERISEQIRIVGNITGNLSLTRNIVGLYLYPDEDYTLAMDLPAVRTRGDVGQLVKLLGRE